MNAEESLSKECSENSHILFGREYECMPGQQKVYSVLQEIMREVGRVSIRWSKWNSFIS